VYRAVRNNFIEFLEVNAQQNDSFYYLLYHPIHK
jgi:hypothetical protein